MNEFEVLQLSMIYSSLARIEASSPQQLGMSHADTLCEETVEEGKRNIMLKDMCHNITCVK